MIGRVIPKAHSLSHPRCALCAPACLLRQHARKRSAHRMLLLEYECYRSICGKRKLQGLHVSLSRQRFLFRVRTGQMKLCAGRWCHLTALPPAPASEDPQSSVSLTFRATSIKMEKSVHTATRT